MIISLSVILSFFTLPVNAEGSRELVAYGGYRPYIESTEVKIVGIKRQAVMKVFVNAGEQINLGSSTYNTDNNQDILYRSPEGTQDGSCDVLKTGFGFIDTRAKEQAGPLPNTGGYTPCHFVATETGIYEVEFRSSQFEAPYKYTPGRAITAPIPIDDKPRSGVAAWDLTVFKTPNDPDTEQKGRLYTNYLPMNISGKSFEINSIFFILNQMGQLYRINLNGIQPHLFIFFSNNKGFKDAEDGNGIPLFKSVLFQDIYNKKVFVHNPGAPDTATDITNKIFFNPPSQDLPLDVQVKLPGEGNTTWLRSSPTELPKVTDFKFTGIEGTPNQAGTSPLTGIFSFKSEMVGRYILSLDLNGNGNYGDENDRMFMGNAKLGDNSITWDGLDGKGNPLLPQKTAYNANINLVAGDVHFPFFDVENNLNGLIVEKVVCDPLPCVVENSTVYYNNAELTGGTTQPEPMAALNGIDSSKGIQKFIDFGDEKAIDTWTSLAEPLKLDNGIQLKQADLTVSKTHATDLPPLAGGPITYTITVRNAGPSDVAGIKVQDSLPATITEPIWRCKVSDSSAPIPAIQNRCADTNGDGPIDTTVDLQNGATATFTINATISDGVAVGDTISNSVTITRPNDVTNPQGTEPDVKSETATDSFTLAPPTNKPPVATDKNTTTTNDTPVSVPAFEATDDDGTVASYTVFNIPDSNQGLLYLGNPSSGVLITEGQQLTPAESANLYFQPNAGFNGELVFNYKATDDQGAVSNTANVTITVTSPPTNNPPVADDKNVADTPNDMTVSVPALSATDTDGTIAFYTIETLPNESEGVLYFGDPDQSGTPIIEGKTLLLSQAGNLFFKPNNSFTGETNFTYTATDNQGAKSNTATVTIPITASAQPPVAKDKTAASTLNNITAQLPALEATDNDGVVSAYEIQSLPPENEGLVYLGDPAKGGKPLRVGEILTPEQANELFFQPNTSFSGQSSFTYSATDNHDTVSNTATVTLPVTTPPNNPPIANDNRANTDPNTLVTISVLTDDSDPDGNLDPSSITITTPPAQGEVVVNADGTVNYTPNSGFTTGSDSFIYEVCDTGSPKLCDTAEVTVTVPSQSPPIADNKIAPSTLNTQTVKVPTLSATDDGKIMFYTIATLPLPEHGVLYLDSPDEGGTPITEGQELTLDQIDKLYFKPNSGFMGNDASFTYSATDNLAAVSSPALVALPVTVPVNTRPTANDDRASTDPETPVTIDILNNDSDPEAALDTDSVTIIQSPPNGSVTISPEGEAIYTPKAGFTTGTDLFTYQVCDSGIPQQCDTAVVTITIPISANKPPVTENKTVPTLPNNITVPLPALSGTDEDGTVTAYTIATIVPESQGLLYLGNPTEGGTLIKAGQSLTPAEVDNLYFQPNENFIGQATFTYTATDNQNAVSNAALVTIPVEAAKADNQPPVATEDRVNTNPETPVNIAILKNDTDPEGNLDPSSVTITTSPANGNVTRNTDGTVIYTPNPSLTTGNDTFIYEICDAGNPIECDSTVVTITVTASTDQPPVAENQQVPTITNDSTAQIPSLLATDDNTIISYTIATVPPENQGVLYLGDPEAGGTPITPGQVLTAEQIKTLFFKPKLDFTGNATFTYTATDNLNNVSSPALVTIPVTGPSNSPPVANDTRATTEPNTPVTLGILKNDSDPNDNLDASSVTLITPPTNGEATVNPDGTITFTPDSSLTEGKESFIYQVCDNATPPLCDTATVEVTVSAVIETPKPTEGNLIVQLSGEGQVRSHPEAINCLTVNTPCSHTFPINSDVTLKAIPDTDWVFEGWRGHCDELGQVTVDTIKQCEAVFMPKHLAQLNLKVSRKGLGTVKSQPSGIKCGSDCSEPFATGSEIELTAVPEPGFAFTGWRGDCSGTEKTVTVTLAREMSCQAQFEPDEDTDGVATTIENGAPNEGDGNNDGIPDSEQNHVVSIRTPDGKYVTIEEKNGCPINNVQLNEQNLPADGQNLTAPPFDFDIACPEAEIVTYYHDVDDLNNQQHRQYVPTTPGDPTTAEWQDLPTKLSSTTIDGKTVPTATFTLKDGELGDSSPADGSIQHTSAIAITPDTVQWSVSRYQVDEFAEVANIRVIRRGKCEGSISVDYAMQDGTAAEHDDYLASTGTLTWEDGDCSEKTFTVTIKDDATSEDNETVLLNLLNPTGRAIITSSEPAVLTIMDDDSGSSSQGNTCYNAAPCQVCCPSCQAIDASSDINNSELKIKSLTTTLKVGETEKITLADGKGELLIKEIPSRTIVSLDAWTPLKVGAGEITLTGQSVGESKMVISDSANPLETLTLYITVIENDSASKPSLETSNPTKLGEGANLRIKALQTTIKVAQNLDFTVAGGEGELSISEIPDQSIVLLNNWAPIGETGTAELSLTGVSVGKTKIVISDHSTPPQKTTINIIVVENEGITDPSTGTGTTSPTGPTNVTDPSDVTVTVPGGVTNPGDVTVTVPGGVTNPGGDVTVTVPGGVTNPGDVTVTVPGGVTNPGDVTVTVPPWGETVTNPSDTGTEPTTDDSTPAYEPTCTNAIGVDKEYNLVDNQTCFTDNLTIRNTLHPNHGWLTRTQAQNLRLATNITIDPNHQGQAADILLVVVYHTLTTDIAYIRDQQTWKIWLPEITELPTAQYFHQLPEKTDIFIAEGDFSPMPGEYTSFVGYRLEEGTIIYNGLEPLHFFVGNSASVNMRIQSHKTPGHNEIQAASIFEPFIHNQEGKVGNNLTFDYSDALTISTFVRVEPEHVGQSADLVMVAGYRRHFEPVETYFLTDSIRHSWELWDNQKSLPTVQHYPQLPALLEIPIYAGSFGGVAGEYFVYLGYRLSGDVVVFNHIPLQLRIANSIGLAADGEKLPTTTYFANFAYQGEYFDNPFKTAVTQPVGLATTIVVDPEHVGQQADILMLALRHEIEPLYPIEAPRWGTWAADEISLEASIPNVTLEPVMKNIPLFQDQFKNRQGYYTIYVGYRLENGDIFYNGGETLRLEVQP